MVVLTAANCAASEPDCMMTRLRLRLLMIVLLNCMKFGLVVRNCFDVRVFVVANTDLELIRLC